MTTTESMSAGPPPPAPPPAPPTVRRLRRSRSDRIGAGVAGGLGEYFRVDPVLFRVLFATAAFFGGAGVLGYLLAWAAIPEEGTERATIDGWVAKLRQHRVPFWLILAAAGLVFWLVAFSWWAPGPFFPVIAVVIVLVIVFGRRDRRSTAPSPTPVSPPAPTPVSLNKPAAAPAEASDSSNAPPAWLNETRTWLAESREASRVRSRRAYPIRIVTVLTLVVTLVTLGLVDATRGIFFSLYFWFALGITATGLLIGLILRRTPWSVVPLLALAIAGLIAFGGTHATLHDGIGQREWTPTSAPSAHYKLAFGRSTLDLRSLNAQTTPRLVRIDQAAGEITIIAPKSLNLRVDANVHIGVVTLDGETPDHGAAGVVVSRTVEPLALASGEPIVVDVHLADGRVDVVRQ